MQIVSRIPFQAELLQRNLFADFFARFTKNTNRYQSRHKNVQEKLSQFYISKSTKAQHFKIRFPSLFLQIHPSFSAFREGKQYFMSPAFCYGKIVYLLQDFPVPKREYFKIFCESTQIGKRHIRSGIIGMQRLFLSSEL